jgi:hypothetical protein
MDSSKHVEHIRIKKHQSWYVHKLGTFKSIQITTLIIIWFLKMILGWIQLQQLCIIIPHPVASLSKLIEILCKYSNSNMRIKYFQHKIDSIILQYDSFYKSESYDHTHPPDPFRHNTWIQYPSYIKLHGLYHHIQIILE